MSIINYLKHSSSGSAIAEFLIFTLPFFIAFLLLITTMQSRSMAIAESKNLARQVIRAYVTSPNEDLANIRAYQVVNLYKANLSPSALANRSIELRISCSNYPCFSRGNRVTATISVGLKDKASASEYVDLWR